MAELSMHKCLKSLSHDDETSAELIGRERLLVQGLAPRTGLQNIFGGNWYYSPAPWSSRYVTYCYIDTPVMAEQLASKYEAILESHPVRVDGDRMAHLIYHGEHDHSSLDGEVDVALMLDTSKDGTKYLQLVLIPEELLKVMEAKERENEKVSRTRQSKLLDKSLATQPYY